MENTTARKAIQVRMEDSQMRELGRYQASVELETGVRPTQADVFMLGISCLKSTKTKPDTTSRQSTSDTERIKSLQEENERMDKQLSDTLQLNDDLGRELAKLRVTRKEDDPSLVKQAVEVATKNCREEMEKVKTDRDKWRASAEQLRAKLAPGLKTGGDLAAARETATNYLKT